MKNKGNFISLYKKLDEILRSDEMYVPLINRARSCTTICDDNTTTFIPFTFGEKTIIQLLNLNFECQRCGECCRMTGNCDKLMKDGTNRCSIHNKPNYPFVCFSYPFAIHESSRRGLGCMTLDENFELVSLQFGLIDKAILLHVFPSEKCWTKGNTLKSIYKEGLRRLANIKKNDIIYQPTFEAKEFINMSGKKMTKKTYLNTYKRKLIAMRPIFLKEVTKI